jgi:hypothetical protein
MRPSGLEPPRTKWSTRPSTLRVYQFRHGRRVGEYSPAEPADSAAAAAAGLQSVRRGCVRPQLPLQCEQVFVSGHRPPEQGAVQTWI